MESVWTIGKLSPTIAGLEVGTSNLLVAQTKPLLLNNIFSESAFLNIARNFDLVLSSNPRIPPVQKLQIVR